MSLRVGAKPAAPATATSGRAITRDTCSGDPGRAFPHPDPEESNLPWRGGEARAAGDLKPVAGRFRFHFPVPVARETERGRAGSCARRPAGESSGPVLLLRGMPSGHLDDSRTGLRALCSLQLFLKQGLSQHLPAGGVPGIPAQHLRSAEHSRKARCCPPNSPPSLLAEA